MRRRVSLWLTTLVCTTALASGAAAQTLPAGTWSGNIAAPDGMSIEVSFQVTVNGDTTAITLKAEFGEFAFNEIKVLEDRVTFSFTPGPLVRCNLLHKEDGSYSGQCTDDSGESATMTMVPPKPGAPADGDADGRVAGHAPARTSRS